MKYFILGKWGYIDTGAGDNYESEEIFNKTLDIDFTDFEMAKTDNFVEVIRERLKEELGSERFQLQYLQIWNFKRIPGKRDFI